MIYTCQYNVELIDAINPSCPKGGQADPQRFFFDNFWKK